MRPFDYARAIDESGAIATVAANPQAKFVAGGTNIIDLIREDVETPSALIDINALPFASVEALTGAGGIRLGALARMSDVAEHKIIRAQYPVISEALLASASPQLRNMASIGGNLLQRTRCSYFRDTASPCNKREPGSGCPAIAGENRMHAVLGTSDACIATHASDLAVALVALDAVIRVRGGRGERQIPIIDFHLLPGRTPHVENVLDRDELIIAVDVPAAGRTVRSHYPKVRDRASYEFALVSAAVALEVTNNRIKSARIALGGMGTKPWRAAGAEKILLNQSADAAIFRRAAEAAIAGAAPTECFQT